MILPCGVNFVALINRLISNCCRRESSVYNFREASDVLKRSSACVLLYFVDGIDYVIADGDSVTIGEVELHVSDLQIGKVDYVIY